MRQIVRAALPLGEGTILDPFMGAGSTIAASIAVGYRSVGVESDPTLFESRRILERTRKVPTWLFPLMASILPWRFPRA